MPKIIFRSFDGQEQVVEAAAGLSAMEAALQNHVRGIDGDCSGAVACGTCHVYVDPAWIERAGPATEGSEREMLDLTDNAQANSRLSCQIILSDALDGLVLTTPENQH